MAEPTIEILDIYIVNGGVDFDAEVAGYTVKLRMPPAFVDDEIKSTDADKVKAYFAARLDDIRTAAWALAYTHSTRGKSPDDAPGPIPYLATLRVPFNHIVLRD